MTEKKVRVGINGYGVIGKRVADAVALQDDMAVAGIPPFVFHVLGMFVPLGHRSAVATIKGLKMRGFLAWWLSRSLHLLRLPTWSNRIRVALDWTLDLFFRKDTVRITLR